MDRHYSNLELVKHDETARAPERDYDATAFELDASALAPQTIPDTTPQVFYDGSLPEAHDNEKPTEEHLNIIKLALKWPWIIMALILAVAIAIGVSVGIWHHRELSFHKPSRVSSPPAPHPTILNDTSLAALSLANGYRHLFFQDNTGLIWRAIRTTSNGEWITSPSLNVSSNPKNYTPLAVTSFDPLVEDDTQITLYYVSENHILNASTYRQDSWWPGIEMSESYTATRDTRSLSITHIEAPTGFPKTNSTFNTALLYYENTHGKISALLRRLNYQVFSTESTSEIQWIDITSQESKALPNEFRNLPGIEYSRTLYESNTNASFSTPFTSVGNLSGFSIGTLFYLLPNASLEIDNFRIPDGAFVCGGYLANSSGPGYFTDDWISLTNDDQEADGPVEYPASLQQSDVAFFGRYYAIWINDTQPVTIKITTPPDDLKAPTPNNAFPFTRLASSSSADQSVTFLYHQINGTTLAEEQWDDTLQAWLPSEYITVSES